MLGVWIDDLAIDLDAPYGNVKSDKPPFLALHELSAVGDLTHTAFIKQESNYLRISPFSVLGQRIPLGLWLRLFVGTERSGVSQFLARPMSDFCQPLVTLGIWQVATN